MSINSMRGLDRIENININTSSSNSIQQNSHINSDIASNKDSRKVISSISAEYEGLTEQGLTDEMFDKAVQEVNKHVNLVNRRIEYKIHEDTNKVMFKIFNNSTDEIIREVPTESRLDALAKMWKMSGIIVDNVV